MTMQTSLPGRQTPSIERLETDRLVGECFRLDHYDQLCRLHRDPVVMATLGGVRSPEATRAFLQGKMDHWRTHGFGYWMFYQKETGRFAGRGGIQHIEIGGRAEVEVGYTVVAALWGRGYATEIARGLIAVGFDQLGLDDLVCFTLMGNRASQRVMAKAGFAFERTVTHEGKPHVLFRLSAAQYTRRQVS